jgi:hypothetical protein
MLMFLGAVSEIFAWAQGEGNPPRLTFRFPLQNHSDPNYLRLHQDRIFHLRGRGEKCRARSDPHRTLFGYRYLRDISLRNCPYQVDPI